MGTVKIWVTKASETEVGGAAENVPGSRYIKRWCDFDPETV
ncbi:unnamed protein product, partial [marine sediment metagenome]